VALAVDGQKHFVEVPRVARPRAVTTELIGLRWPTLPAPRADGFIGDQHATDKEELFDVPVAEAEAVVQPDAVTDNFGGKTMMFVALRSSGRGHA
jgi:hypothetical protein